MSGRRIDDHASFAGKSGKYPLPDGNKMKTFHSAEGNGEVHEYPDTTERIHSDQMKGDAQAKKQKLKPGYRN